MKNNNTTYKINEDSDEVRIPISEVRNNIKDVVNNIKESSNPYYITRRGEIQAVLVNQELWKDMNKRIKEIYKKTFINPKHNEKISYFKNEEIAEWADEDKL